MVIKTKKAVFILLIVLGLIFTIVGATFAFFAASTNATGNQISGASYTFNVNLDATAIKSGKLIPVADNLIISTLNSSHVCEDTRGYGLCTLYRIRFTNSGSAETMTGNLKTLTSTYTTNNLKYQLFTLSGSTYSAISTATAINRTANAINYFKLNSIDVTISLNDGSSSSTTKDVYLAIWISDPGNNQLDDQNKTFTGQLSFTSTHGSTITSNFINS